MSVIGHGIDVVSLSAFERILDEPESDFLERVFSVDEQASASSSASNAQGLAGKFCVKEAFAKALGTGFDGNLDPSEIEVLHNTAGAPVVRISGSAASSAASVGVQSWVASISHAGDFVIASVIVMDE